MYEIRNHSSLIETINSSESIARIVAKELSLERGERIAIHQKEASGSAERKNIFAFVQGIEENNFLYQITIAKTESDAMKKADFFIKSGIPAITKTDRLFGWSIMTTREHSLLAGNLYEENCRIINVITNEVIREATWNL